MNSMSDELSWDDMRLFLATMRAPSLKYVAQSMGISRPTAGRHLTALESRLGVRLFERRPDGLHATPAAVALVEPAEVVERAMQAATRSVRNAQGELRGPVRVTLPDIAASELLMPTLVAFCRQWPLIELHIDASYDLSDLARAKADVAIRFMRHGTTPDAELMGRLAATVYVAAYGSGDWIGQSGDASDALWVAQTPFPDVPVRGSMRDAGLQRTACAAGLGRVWLPCFYADPVLTRCSDPVPGFDIWVLVHPDLRRNPRLKAFRDAVVAALRDQADRLAGCRA
ncbi:MAG: DNA-binding transcriptional LysR family regulator [Kiritimatiellia bacterium]|jgi:DNA-binding transcriptional LysR family regulator